MNILTFVTHYIHTNFWCVNLFYVWPRFIHNFTHLANISPVWFCIFKQLSCEKLYKTAITLYSHCSLKIGQGICKYDSLLIYIFLLYFYQLWKQTMFILLCFTAMQPSLEQTDFCLRDSQWLIMFSSVEFCSVGGVSISWFVLQSHSMHRWKAWTQDKGGTGHDECMAT